MIEENFLTRFPRIAESFKFPCQHPGKMRPQSPITGMVRKIMHPVGVGSQIVLFFRRTFPKCHFSFCCGLLAVALFQLFNEKKTHQSHE